MSSDSRNPDQAWLATLTVLYVENDETTRVQLARFLRRRVERVVEASNGNEGLACFRAARPSLVVTDIEMPEMDGLAMAGEIRRLDPNVPIVVTTAFEQVDYLRRSIDAGVDKFVSKPVDVEKLESALVACAHHLRAEALLVRERERELSAHEAHKREALGLLAGGMAHDFNNLVQVVLANIDLATSLVTPGTELSELIDAALAASRRAAQLGTDLHTLSEGMFLDVRARRLESTLRSALAIRGLTVQLDLPPELPEVPHDSELLGRAFEQLAENAREATGGTGVLSVAARPRRLAEGEVPPLIAGDYLEVTFRDTGPGIRPEILPRIFDPYFSTKPRGGVRGMGLGLSLCLAIMRKHQGYVTASSPEGGGALFTVLLPTLGPPPSTRAAALAAR
jgi:signal transduction histidine kinase